MNKFKLTKMITLTILIVLFLIFICGAWFFSNLRGKILTKEDLTQEKLPSQYILSKKPLFITKEDVGQTYAGHYGTYTAKAVLNYYGKDTKEKPYDYHISWTSKTFKALLPQPLTRLLKYYGVNSEVKITKNLTDEDKLKAIKQELIKDAPVSLLVGSGYKPDGTYYNKFGKYPGHWISIWGFDDSQGIFYIYDNAMSNSVVNKDLPNGNITRTYQNVLRDWHGPFYMWGARYVYISIIK